VYEAAPGDGDALIWLGRRTAYLGEYGAAIELFSRGVEEHPEDARFLRHRGHRYLTVRELALARADLLRAVELVEGEADRVEPDGLPNAAGIPRTTLHFNIWYHLGLAHYLAGELERAVLAWQEALDVSRNDDARVAATYWLHNTLRRLNLDRTAAELLATIAPGMEILENGAYHELLLLHQGARTPEEILGPGSEGEAGPTGPEVADATRGYGVAVWHLVNGRRESAFSLMESITASTDAWAAFGYLAAEADLARSTE
jgi:tetratricopeptide (TPR) repeat protein